MVNAVSFLLCRLVYLHLDPPKAGEHTYELLDAMGLNIAELKTKGVI